MTKALQKPFARRWIIFSAVMVAVVCFFFVLSPVYAAEGSTGSSDFFSWLKQTAGSIYNSLYDVTNVAAAVAGLFCLLMLMFSHNQKSVDQYRDALKWIALAWVAINIMGFILTTGQNLTNGGKFTPS